MQPPALGVRSLSLVAALASCGRTTPPAPDAKEGVPVRVLTYTGGFLKPESAESGLGLSSLARPSLGHGSVEVTACRSHDPDVDLDRFLPPTRQKRAVAPHRHGRPENGVADCHRVTSHRERAAKAIVEARQRGRKRSATAPTAKALDATDRTASAGCLTEGSAACRGEPPGARSGASGGSQHGIE
jgi:hypothetical protein